MVAFLYPAISALSLFALDFKYMHLADAFIHSDLQCIQGSVYILSACLFPGTHDLGFASASSTFSYLFISHHFSVDVHHLFFSATGAHVVCAIGAQLQAESEACGKADVLLK